MDRKQALKQLESFAGNWLTSGRMLTANSGHTEISGTDTYAWVADGAFLLHRVDVMMGGARQQSVEMIGYDEANGCFTMESYGQDGSKTAMTATYRDQQWFYQGGNLRFAGAFSHEENRLSGTWEQKDEAGNWTMFLEIRLDRQL